MPTHSLVMLGSAWADIDGSASAPAGTAQYPTLLDAYGTVPPWSVAGVDYKVGIPTGTSLTAWTTLSGTGITVNADHVRVENTSAVEFDSVDFSTGSGAYLLIVNSPGTIVRRCRFAGTTLEGISGGVIHADATSGSLTVEYCEMNGEGAGTSPTLIYVAASGTFTLRYNYFHDFPQHIIEFAQSADKSFSTVYKYNLIYNGAMEAGAHLNWIQFIYGTSTSCVVEFNTAYQSEQVASGEGYQFYAGITGISSGGPVLANSLNYNVMIADDVTPGDAMSYIVHAGDNATFPTDNTGSVAHDNYMVLTGAFGPWYAGTFTDWTLSNNYNMVTGAALSTNP